MIAMRNLTDCRIDFPILNDNGENTLIYFDNASTTHKPDCVIQEISEFYSSRNSNIHRGLYPLSLEASDQFEKVRENIKKFINARSASEIIFTKGTTEGINLLSYCLGESYFKKGDEIILSILEHHSNIVPWQMLSKKLGLKLIFIPVDNNCELFLEHLKDAINIKTKLISITHISNSMGTINPIKDIVNLAKDNGTLVLIDGAQSIGHQSIDVQNLGCDFFVFSGHKIYGPTGTGILFAKEEYLRQFNPYQTGGNQIKSVSTEHTEFAEIPHKFEPGTPNIAGFLGLSKAIDYIKSIGFDAIEAHEKALTTVFLNKLKMLNNIQIIGNPQNRAGIISLNFTNIHPTDIGILLGQAGVCVRTGFHCNEPLMNFLNLKGTVRISLGLYNTLYEIDLFFEKLMPIMKMLQ